MTGRLRMANGHPAFFTGTVTSLRFLLPWQTKLSDLPTPFD